jgi:hypothetical protein
MALCDRCEEPLASPDSPCAKCGHFVSLAEKLAQRIQFFRSFQSSFTPSRSRRTAALLAVIAASVSILLGGIIPSCALGREIIVSPVLCPQLCAGCSGPARVDSWSTGVDDDSGNDFALVCKPPPGVVAEHADDTGGPYAISRGKTLLAYVPVLLGATLLFFGPLLLRQERQRRRRRGELDARIESLEGDLAKLTVGPYRGGSGAVSPPAS